ncbi:hypothetical protein EDB85DRAFT_261899 [Lactarius pseudohatsudake]|nr:hypothetical protein EDB85DRAFT_261899 [Lactarius pseudohatsudake]
MDHASTPTRSRRPADALSELFDFVPKVSERVSRDSARSLHSKANKPVAKRMLGRTRSTLSAVDGPTASASLESMASNSLNASAGLPLSPHHIPDLGSAGSQTPTITGEQFQSNIGTSTAPLQRSNVRTYTGRSRSFLVELPTEGNPHGAIDGDDLGLETRESYKDLRMRWGVDDSEDDPRLAVSTRSSPEPENGRKGKGRAKDRPKRKVLLPPNMMNDLKSITELRSKGESRRFMDEVGYLFEGMDRNVGVRVRRGSALELVTKLCDPDFARRARVTDFRSRAWDALRASGAGNGDKVLDAILVLFAALVLQTSHEVTELTQKADFVPVLWNVLASSSGADSLELLGNGANDGELKKAGIGKAEKLTLMTLRSVIVNKSGLFADEEYLSLCQLASRTLASLPPSVHRPVQLAPLRQTLIVGLSFLSPRLSGYASGLPLLPNSSDLAPSSGVPQFNHIADSLDIFDSLLLGRWSSDEDPPPLYHDVINGNEQDDLAEGLVTLCAVCNILLRNSDYDNYSPRANRCLESALRVLINVSHENPTWCRLLLHQKLMIPVISSLIALSLHGPQDVNEESSERSARAFDRLCLALGLLTNLVQVDEDAKDICRETKLDPSCPALRQCAYACSCPNAVTVLECLALVYERHLRLEDDDPGTHIIRGHFAVLFGLLMRGSTGNQSIILNVLPGAGLEGLIRHAKEFVGLYAEFMARVARGEGHDAGDTEEDDSEETMVQVPTKDSATQDVAQDVIKFLESLMDG